jgi:hypothetical protein
MRHRRIRLTEPASGLDMVADLLEAEAPRAAAALWAVAGMALEHDALHAIWTGPEICWQVPTARLSAPFDVATYRPEQATMHPAAGDIALCAVAASDWPGSGGDFLDIGLFYADGARLLLPHGWVHASVCARIPSDDLDRVAAACRAIRLGGRCRLRLTQMP